MNEKRLFPGLVRRLPGQLAAALAAASLAGCSFVAARPPAATASAPPAVSRPALASAAPAAASPPRAGTPLPAAAPPPAAAAVRELARWAVRTGDHERLPFGVLDKNRAALYLFGPDGKPRGATAVLLGSARGDHSVPGIGDRPIAEIRPEERTTPAGRFLVEPGRNHKGEDIYWLDYDAAVSIHRVRAHNVRERRLERLASPGPGDNRISYGCVNLPASFYDGALKPLFGRRAVVYVLPETQPWQQFFGVRSSPAKHAARSQEQRPGS